VDRVRVEACLADGTMAYLAPAPEKPISHSKPRR
jgi:hypothetical protein